MVLSDWFILVLACSAMSFSPGPNAMLALTTSIKSGHSKGLQLVLGGALGFAVLILCALFGLNSMVVASEQLIDWFKVIGSGYLLYLATSTWINSSKGLVEASSEVRSGYFFKGFLLALSNPKIILFWIAFIPTIVDVSTIDFSFVLILLLTFLVIEVFAEGGLVLLGAKAQKILQKHVTRIERVSAIILAGFAVLILSASQ
ncbi:LysE family translocator [Pseudoalteromonas luteoviolacea]|uniref:LysE family translocator n=1 Tax=Pseudoalteromonas luteoviolacea TaxID=43657 RepID=UPI001F2561F1|nr:LysE family translocator [Pseudoalteromonas luteoviolacea]MCF6439186.1 LysE family translocator [Pseudoalteromonas luteoviolacea]